MSINCLFIINLLTLTVMENNLLILLAAMMLPAVLFTAELCFSQKAKRSYRIAMSIFLAIIALALSCNVSAAEYELNPKKIEFVGIKQKAQDGVDFIIFKYEDNKIIVWSNDKREVLHHIATASRITLDDNDVDSGGQVINFYDNKDRRVYYDDLWEIQRY